MTDKSHSPKKISRPFFPLQCSTLVMRSIINPLKPDEWVVYELSCSPEDLAHVESKLEVLFQPFGLHVQGVNMGVVVSSDGTDIAQVIFTVTPHRPVIG
jgi:hypothetical protein